METENVKGLRPITRVFILQWLQRYVVILGLLGGAAGGVWRLSFVVAQEVDKIDSVIEKQKQSEAVQTDLSRKIDQIMFRLQITPAPKDYYLWPNQGQEGQMGKAQEKPKHSFADPSLGSIMAKRQPPPQDAIMDPDAYANPQ
jgi:hypothetical protein